MDFVKDEVTGNKVAKEGRVFVCAACGKRSKDLYGYQKISHGWDESCMLNAVLCKESDVVLKEGRVVEIKGPLLSLEEKKHEDLA